LVVHNEVGCGDERAAKADAGQHPSALEAEDVEEEVDVSQKVFVPEHAAVAESVVGGEVCFPDSGTFVRVAAASGASTNSGRRAGSAVASAAAENEPTTCSATRSWKRAGVSVLSVARRLEGGPCQSQASQVGWDASDQHAAVCWACCSEQAKSKCSPGIPDTQKQLCCLKRVWCGAVRDVKECPGTWYEERSVLQFF
jgi:hypothetical protein